MPAGVFAGMKPRIRTVPPRVATLASPPGSRSSRSPPRPTRRSRPRSTPTAPDAHRRRRRPTTSRSASTRAANITHNFGAADGAREQHRLRPGPGARHAPLQRHDQLVTQPRRRQRQHQPLGRRTSPARRRSTAATATTSSSAGATSTPSTAATATTASPAFRGNETINGGDGNDVIIWNNGDGNDNNQGGAGVDETLITDGQGRRPDDASRRDGGRHALRPHQRAVQRRHRATIEKLTLTSFSGNDRLTTDPGVPTGIADRRRSTAGPRQRQHHDRRRPAATASSATAATTR